MRHKGPHQRPGASALVLQAELRACGLDPAQRLARAGNWRWSRARHHPAAVEGRTLYELIGATVQQYVLACIGDQAGLLVAEDVHWFDPSTLGLALLGAGSRGRAAAGGLDRT